MRKGMGKGQGLGWKNLRCDDSRRHSLASKGIKSAQKIPKIPTGNGDIKGWKKTGKDEWSTKEDFKVSPYRDYREPNYRIDVNSSGTGKDKMFGVWYYSNLGLYSNLLNKFKSKQEAIKFAKSYMKNNPKG